MPFPSEKVHFPTEKMHFPTERCGFRRACGGKPQEIAGGLQGPRAKNASQLSQELNDEHTD